MAPLHSLVVAPLELDFGTTFDLIPWTISHYGHLARF